MTFGWQNSDLIIIAARPAMGKTAFIFHGEEYGGEFQYACRPVLARDE